MKRTASIFFAMLLAATIPLAVGAESSKAKRQGTPEDSVFVFGVVNYMVRFTQTDPEFEPAFYECSWGVYHFGNVEPGSYLKLTTYERNTGTYWIYTLGLSGKSSLDFRVPDKPGLYYAGCMDFSEIKNNTLLFKPYRPEKDKYNELWALKWIVRKMDDSAWKPVVENRIKELESEGK